MYYYTIIDVNSITTDIFIAINDLSDINRFINSITDVDS